jgi:hypothetical protein
MISIDGIAASNISLDCKKAKYLTGYGVSLDMLRSCGVACTILFSFVRRENQKRDCGDCDCRLEYLTDADSLDDDHPHFRLTT